MMSDELEAARIFHLIVIGSLLEFSLLFYCVLAISSGLDMLYRRMIVVESAWRDKLSPNLLVGVYLQLEDVIPPWCLL